MKKIKEKITKFILVLIVLNVIAVILSSFNSIYDNYALQFRYFEIFSVIIFTIEFLIRIKFFKKDYFFSFMGIIDFLAILPFYVPFIIPFDLRFLRIIRVLRILRILKLNRYAEALNVVVKVIKKKKEQLLSTIFVTVLLILFSSALMYPLENAVQPKAFPNIIATFWWSIATLTTVGYGDIYPITVGGKILSSIVAFLGIGLVALPTGIISSGFLEEIENQKTKSKNMICPHCEKEIDLNEN